MRPNKHQILAASDAVMNPLYWVGHAKWQSSGELDHGFYKTCRMEVLLPRYYKGSACFIISSFFLTALSQKISSAGRQSYYYSGELIYREGFWIQYNFKWIGTWKYNQSKTIKHPAQHSFPCHIKLSIGT